MNTPGMPPLEPARLPLYRRPPVLITVAVLAIVGVVLVLTLSHRSSKKDIQGQFTLTGGSSAFNVSGATCKGTGDWAYLKPGGSVTLCGEHSDYLASTGLQAGKPSSKGQCIFTFDLGKVSTTSGSYVIVIGGKFTKAISKTQLKSIGYTFYAVDGL